MRISIEILKTTNVVVVWQRGYVERWKCWLNRIWQIGPGHGTFIDSARRCCRQPRISGYFWDVNPTSRSFSANNRQHQQNTGTICQPTVAKRLINFGPVAVDDWDKPGCVVRERSNVNKCPRRWLSCRCSPAWHPRRRSCSSAMTLRVSSSNTHLNRLFMAS